MSLCFREIVADNIVHQIFYETWPLVSKVHFDGQMTKFISYGPDFGENITSFLKSQLMNPSRLTVPQIEVFFGGDQFDHLTSVRQHKMACENILN